VQVVNVYISFALDNSSGVKSPYRRASPVAKSQDCKAGPHQYSVKRKQEQSAACNKPKTINITKTMLRSSIRPPSPYMSNKSTTLEYSVADDKKETEIESVTQQTSSPSQDGKKISLDHDDICLLSEKIDSAGNGKRVCYVIMLY